MPKYQYKLANGKTLTLEGSTQPSDDEVESIAKEQGVELAMANTPPPVDTTPVADVAPIQQPAARQMSNPPRFTSGEFSDLQPNPNEGVVSPDEPGSYWGGFFKGLKEYAIGTPDERSKAFSAENPFMQSAANPQTAGDILNLVIPANLPRMTRIPEVARRISGESVEPLPSQPFRMRDGNVEVVAPKREQFHQPEGFPKGPKTDRFYELTDKATAGTITADELKEATKLNRELRGFSERRVTRADVNLPPEMRLEGEGLPPAQSTNKGRRAEDKIYDLAREKFNMGKDKPEFDPNFNAGMGDPELAGSIPYKQAFDPSTLKFGPDDEISQLVKQSGLTEPAIAPEVVGLEAPTVYHGTQNTFEGFDTARNQPQGLFRNMNRFTEDPEYSQLYSLGENPAGQKRIMPPSEGRPQTIAAKIGAKNVLDLTKPLSPEQLSELRSTFPNIPENATSDYIQDVLSRTTEPLPFDAIRYSEHGKVNWAVPEKTPLNTPQGVPLNRAAMQQGRSAAMDARNPGFRGTANEMSESRGFATQGNQPSQPQTPGIDPRTQAMLDRNNQIAKMANESQKKSLWGEVRDANRAILTSFDFSAAGRQGKPLLMTKAYWTSLDDMAKAWGSQRASDLVDESIMSMPIFQKPKLTNGKLGKSIAERAGIDISKAEQFQSNVAEKFVPGVKRSERAYNAFLNKLRADHLNAMVNDARRMGMNPDGSDVILKQIGDFINDATGRGSLGKMERAAPILNEVFFAPKLMASRVNMYRRWLNPRTYSNANPVVRKQAIKSLLSTVGFGLGVGELARMGGAQVSNDPRSSDFRKIKIGDNVRIDPFSGFQQYAVGASRLLSGQSQSSRSNRVSGLGNFQPFADIGLTDEYQFNPKNPTQPSRGSVASQFFQNKLAPIPSLVWSWMEGKDWDGQPFEVKKALLDRTIPIVMQDLYELQQEDPKLLPLGILPIMGEGLQTYGR